MPAIPVQGGAQFSNLVFGSDDSGSISICPAIFHFFRILCKANDRNHDLLEKHAGGDKHDQEYRAAISIEGCLILPE